MNAKRMQKPIAKLARRSGLRRCSAKTESGEFLPLCRGIGSPACVKPKWTRTAPKTIQSGESIKGGLKPEVLGEAGCEEAAEEIAGDVPGDVGRERSAGIDRAAMLAQIREGEREGRRHAQALSDPQRT